MIHSSCPAALSFIFKPCPNSNPIKAGSIGVGCTIDKMVEVTISTQGRSPLLLDLRSFSEGGAGEGQGEVHNQTQIFFNGQTILFPTVDYVVSKLTDQPVTVMITSPLPLGYGFGISGASSLATANALNTLYSLKKTPQELAAIAHTAEIRNKTGLGTVATQITGGFLVKTAPGLPVQSTRLPFSGQQLYVTIIDKMETPGILSDAKLLQRVSQAADQALETIKQSLGNPSSLSQILDISYTFIRESGLPIRKKTQVVIEDIRHQGGSATMAILGQMVISTIPASDPLSYRQEHCIISANSPATTII